MNITCPHCGFSKDIAERDIPEDATRVNCPRCGQPFPFSRPAIRPEPPPIPTVQSTVQTAAAGYAGFWLRVVACLIDSLAVTLVQGVCGILFGLATNLLDTGFGGGQNRGIFPLIWLFTTVIGLAYYVVFTGACGQTLGKMALRIKVVRTDGGDLGYGGAFLREVPGKFISGLILGIGYLMVAFDQRKQGLHDKIAGSLVVKL
jgi:predicted Zn finger-like uncharacterized protein